MNKILKRLLPISLSALMLLTACGNDDAATDDASADDAVAGSAAPEDSAMTEVPPIDLAPDAVVMTIDGKDITAEEYATYVVLAKANIESMLGPVDWASDDFSAMTEPLLLDATANLKTFYAIDKVIENSEFEVTAEMEEQAQAEIDAVIEQSGGEEAYEQLLVDNYTTREIFEENVRLNVIFSEYTAYLYGEEGIAKISDEELLTNVNDTYLRAQHILIGTLSDEVDEATGQAVPLEGDELQAKIDLANDVLAKVNAGEDFDTLMAEYSEDPGSQAQPEGYFFGPNEMVPEFEQGTRDLEPNATSGLVESTYGYHIIKRLPIDAEYLADEINRSNIEAMVYSPLLEAEVTAASEALVMTESEDLAKITVANASQLINAE